jgi:UDP:flavonoid glycosyltransferase YjiC (YdhE family)
MWRPDVVVCERAEFAGPLAAAAHDVPHVEYHWGVAPLAEYRPAAMEELAGAPAAPAPVEVFNPWPAAMRLPHAAEHRGLRSVAYNGDALVPDWVLRARDRPRVCVTVGTTVPHIGRSPVRDLMGSVLERLRRLGVEVLVAADERTTAAWPELAASADRVGLMPLGQVLPTCDLVVNHGGQGTILTAIAAGCPQLVVPQFDDQFDNADAVVRSGAGTSLRPEEATPDSVAEHCAALLDDGRSARTVAARIAAEMAAQPSPVEVMDLLSKAAGR